MAGERLRGWEISYNGIVERGGEAGLGGGRVVERDDMNSREINDVESTEPGNLLHLNLLHLSPEGIGKEGSAVARSDNFIFSCCTHMRD